MTIQWSAAIFIVNSFVIVTGEWVYFYKIIDAELWTMASVLHKALNNNKCHNLIHTQTDTYVDFFIYVRGTKPIIIKVVSMGNMAQNWTMLLTENNRIIVNDFLLQAYLSVCFLLKFIRVLFSVNGNFEFWTCIII